MTGSKQPILIDSSGWLEYLTAGPKADPYAKHFTSDRTLLVPAIVIYEVTKILLRKHSKTAADAFLSQALRHTVVSFDEQLALSAASFSLQYHLPMADAIVYASAVSRGALLLVSDQHFSKIPGVLLI